MSMAPHDSATPTHLEGGFVGVRAAGIVGWAWDPDRPHHSLEVEFLLDGEPAGQARAELFDAELAERRLGNGSHSFHFRLDRIPSLPCEVLARFPGTDRSFGPLRIDNVDDLARAVDPSVRYEGAIEEFVRGKGRIHGWAFDRLKPTSRVRVTLLDWEEPLAEVKADIHRPGLEASGKGDGACAFAIRLPVSLLDGRQHTLRITVEDTDLQLPGSPIMFEPTMARDLVETIAPWRADVLRIESALSRLDQLIDRIDSQQARPSLGARITNAIQRSALAEKVKTLFRG